MTDFSVRVGPVLLAQEIAQPVADKKGTARKSRGARLEPNPLAVASHLLS
jgi:hypothetical protein